MDGDATKGFQFFLWHLEKEISCATNPFELHYVSFCEVLNYVQAVCKLGEKSHSYSLCLCFNPSHSLFTGFPEYWHIPAGSCQQHHDTGRAKCLSHPCFYPSEAVRQPGRTADQRQWLEDVGPQTQSWQVGWQTMKRVKWWLTFRTSGITVWPQKQALL